MRVGDDSPPPASVRRTELAKRIVGRGREVDLVLAAVTAGRDLLLEGPPGTSKSTILRAITESWGIPLMFVEGNGELTPARLVGHHNPARVLREDYSADNFVPGPLVDAMQRGGFLYIEELNRAPRTRSTRCSRPWPSGKWRFPGWAASMPGTASGWWRR